MAWQGIQGHDDVAERFRRALHHGRLASSFLFVGPAGVGKRAFALRLAQSLLCQRRPAEALDPCGACPDCVQVLAGTHPDLDVISKPPEKSFLPVALFIGEGGQRMREGLCRRIQLKPFSGSRKIAIVDDADALNEESANCLLKTLEEPPPGSVLILIGTSPDKQLPTIRSRCQLMRFQPLRESVVVELLLRQELVADRDEALRLAAHCEGSLQRARELSDPELWAFRVQFFSRLAALPLDGVALARMVNAFVDGAGKEAAARRSLARQVIRFTVDFFRYLERSLVGLQLACDAELRQAVESMAARWTSGVEGAVACVDRSLLAGEQVDRNAHLATLIDAWMDDLAQAARGNGAVMAV